MLCGAWNGGKVETAAVEAAGALGDRFVAALRGAGFFAAGFPAAAARAETAFFFPETFVVEAFFTAWFGEVFPGPAFDDVTFFAGPELEAAAGVSGDRFVAALRGAGFFAAGFPAAAAARVDGRAEEGDELFDPFAGAFLELFAEREPARTEREPSDDFTTSTVP